MKKHTSLFLRTDLLSCVLSVHLVEVEQYTTQFMQENTYQSSLGLDKRSVLSVHLVVEATGVTEVVAVTIPPPQRG